MLGLFLSALILGVVISVMEGEFPPFGSLILCVLAAIVPVVICAILLPESFFWVGSILGAICAGMAISAITGMPVKRATIAAIIFFVCETILHFGMVALLRTPTA